MSNPVRSPAPQPGVAGSTPAPGWPEMIVGLAVLALVAYGTGPVVLTPLGLGRVAQGLALGALSGVAGIVAFLVAMVIRVRSLAEFGVRRTSLRWILLGVLGGVIALVASRIAGLIQVIIGASPETIQDPYTDAGSAGLWSVGLSLIFLAILTPLGEELLFRGVVTTVLLRYGAVVGVLGSAVVFVVMHGINAVFITALIVGVIAAELRRRSGSVWPGFVVHLVNNAVSQLIVLLLAGSL